MLCLGIVGQKDLLPRKQMFLTVLVVKAAYMGGGWRVGMHQTNKAASSRCAVP